MSAAATDVAVVVVSWNAREDLRACLASLRATAAGVPVIVVDNASDDGSPAVVREAFSDVVLLEPGANLGFAAGCNLGARHAQARFLLLLNPDAELKPGALAELVRVLEERPEAGAVGPRTLNADGTPQLSWGPALSPLAELLQRRRMQGVRARDPRTLADVDRESRQPAEPDWVSGACLLLRAEAFEAVGGFDEGYFLYEEDVDLCVRLRAAGWRVLYHPGAEVVHRLGRSTARQPERVRLDYHRSHLHYYARHQGPGARAVLRVLMLAEGGLDWLRSLGPGAERALRRRTAQAVMGLALRGR